MHSRDAHSDGEGMDFQTHMVKFSSVSLEKTLGLGLSSFLERIIDRFDYAVALCCCVCDAVGVVRE
jgi:hypothetical protein